MNIFVLNKGGSKIGVLSNQGANPPAPFFDDLFTQELETGADTYYFSSISNSSTENLFVIGNKIMFEYNNKQRLFTIASIEYEHKDGQKIIGVYAEGIGFELLDVFMEKPKKKKEPGNDSDLDGDDNYDDEYGDPDDVWIDADGNIVYIKNNKQDGEDYGSPDDVWIDEDGTICYKKNRDNADRDSLEIKSLSYSNFLNLILKNTGWSYQCQPGLESNKQDMSIRYNTNIYAILQDSMQSYQGVELEFIYEYNNGNIKRVVKAYKNGGRGSKTGKRLQYGVNVRGITKMQEIVDEKEEDVVYEGIATINGHQVQLTYDVDIALKSMDVEAMRIGDGYKVIDHDFRPVMEFDARIGKIEISFSDPTRNKCYIANFKQIRGAVSENGDSTDEDDIEDLIDDKLEEYEVGEHTHDRLVLEEDETYQVYLTKDGTVPCLLPTTDDFRLGFDGNRWLDIWSRFVTVSDQVIIDSEDGLTNKLESQRITIETEDDPNRWLSLGLNNIRFNSELSKTLITPAKIETVRIAVTDTQIDFDASHMATTKLIETEGLPGTVVSEEGEVGDGSRAASTSISKKDLLNFILNDVKLYDLEYDIVKKLDPDGEEMYLGIIHSDYFNGHSVSPVGERIFRCIYNDLNNDGVISGDEHTGHSYNLSALVCALIGAFQQYVLTQVMYATVDYVEKAVTNVDAWTNTLQVVDEGDIEPLASTPDKINGGYIMDGTLKGSQVDKSGTNHILTSTDVVDGSLYDASNKPATASSVYSAYHLAEDAYEKAEDALNKANEALNNSGTGSDSDLNGAIEYIATGGGHMLQEPYLKVNTEMQMEKGLIVHGDFVITGENSEGVGGLIVPGMSADEATIGALTCNTINGVDVDNLLSSTATASIDLSEEQQETISTLQNTVQQQQETIAALEARLARIEQYLDLGDDI